MVHRTAPSEIWKEVSAAVAAANAKVDLSADELTDTVSEWYNAMQQALKNADFSPKDYHPPAYPHAQNTTEEVEEQEVRSQVCCRYVAVNVDVCKSLNFNMSFRELCRYQIQSCAY